VWDHEGKEEDDEEDGQMTGGRRDNLCGRVGWVPLGKGRGGRGAHLLRISREKGASEDEESLEPAFVGCAEVSVDEARMHGVGANAAFLAQHAAVQLVGEENLHQLGVAIHALGIGCHALAEEA